MAKKKKITQKEAHQKVVDHIEQHIKWIANQFDWHGNNYSVSNIVPDIDKRDFSILLDFTDEELAQELCRRTALGRELE
jgi:hypothetical protein